MPKLGDSFAETDRLEHVRRQLTPGAILYLFCEFTDPSKEKYLVLVSMEPRPLFFVANSNVSKFIADRPELLKCQVRLNASQYPFLRYDSFVDCSQVIDSLDKDEIVKQLIAELGRIKGTLSETTKQQITGAAQEAKTISSTHKEAIKRALRC